MTGKGLAAELDGLEQASGQRFKIDVLYGDQPEVLDAILRARERGVSPKAIGEKIGVSRNAVESWLEHQESLERQESE